MYIVGFWVFIERIMKQDDWLDPRHSTSWLLFISASAWLISTAWMMITIFLIFFEDFEGKTSRKISMIAFFVSLFVFALYYCVGFFQLFFVERLDKFIVWKANLEDDYLHLNGYFGKKDSFSFSDVVSVEKFIFRKSIKNIITLLAWRCDNYLVELKDGRKFYFSAGMDEGGSLATLLGKGLQ
jgi:hypothetical protein